MGSRDAYGLESASFGYWVPLRFSSVRGLSVVVTLPIETSSRDAAAAVAPVSNCCVQTLSLAFGGCKPEKIQRNPEAKQARAS